MDEMQRGTWYYDKATRKLYKKEKEAKVQTHGIVFDEIPPTVSNATDEGLVFTSRSKLLEHYAQHGYRCTFGDHLTGKIPEAPGVDKDGIREAAEKSFYDLKYGRVPLTEMEKECTLREERVYKAWKKRNGYR